MYTVVKALDPPTHIFKKNVYRYEGHSVNNENSYYTFIHSNLISCSLIGSLVNTRSVLKMSTALRVLRQDCAQTARGAFGA